MGTIEINVQLHRHIMRFTLKSMSFPWENNGFKVLTPKYNTSSATCFTKIVAAREWATPDRVEKYLRRIMIIANKKSTSASSYIMPSPLGIKDTSIKIESLFFTFLKNYRMVELTQARNLGEHSSKQHNQMKYR